MSKRWLIPLILVGALFLQGVAATRGAMLSRYDAGVATASQCLPGDASQDPHATPGQCEHCILNCSALLAYIAVSIGGGAADDAFVAPLMRQSPIIIAVASRKPRSHAPPRFS